MISGRGLHPRMMDESFLTTERFSRTCRFNSARSNRLIKAGKIPAVRVCRQWRFRKRDIDAWLETRVRGIAPAQAPARGRARGQRGRPGSWSWTPRPPSAICWPDPGAGGVRRRPRAGWAHRPRAPADDPYSTAHHRLKMRAWTAHPSSAKRGGSRPTCRDHHHRYSNEPAPSRLNLVSRLSTKPFRVPRVLSAASKALGIVCSRQFAVGSSSRALGLQFCRCSGGL